MDASKEMQPAEERSAAEALAEDSGHHDLRAEALARIYELLRLTVVAATIILALWLLRDVLIVVFAAALLATILHGLSRVLMQYAGLPHWAALLIVVLVLVGAFGALIGFAGPGLLAQSEELRKAVVGEYGALRDRVSHLPWGPAILDQLPGGSGDHGGGSGLPSPGSVAGYVAEALGVVGTVTVMVIASLYFAASPETYVDGAMRLVPKQHRGWAKELAEVGGRALWLWSAGQALDMLVVGVLLGLGLWLIGIKLALVLGVFAGLCNFVPYIGVIVGGTPTLLLAFAQGTTPGLEALGLYFFVEAIEGYVILPLIQKRAVDLPPGLTILSQTFFGAVLGIAGFIFATPLTAALLAVMQKATTPLSPDEEVQP